MPGRGVGARAPALVAGVVAVSPARDDAGPGGADAVEAARAARRALVLDGRADVARDQARRDRAAARQAADDAQLDQAQREAARLARACALCDSPLSVWRWYDPARPYCRGCAPVAAAAARTWAARVAPPPLLDPVTPGADLLTLPAPAPAPASRVTCPTCGHAWPGAIRLRVVRGVAYCPRCPGAP